MNETTHKALMVVVERAVRPVRAGETRKFHMREELLAHLTAIFEEEMAHCGDEQVSLKNAQQRFGDPRELAEELYLSVPFMNRVRYLLEILSFRADDSWLQLIGKYLLLTSLMIVMGILFVVFLFIIQGKYAAIYHIFWLVTGILSKTFATIMAMMMLGVIFMERLRKTYFSQGSRLYSARAIMDILISLCVFPLLAFIHYAAQTSNLAESLLFFYKGCIIAPLAPLLFILLARQYDREMRDREKWANLEIGD